MGADCSEYPTDELIKIFSENEIPVARELLEGLDISGAMITADAMHTQIETADYLKKEGRTTY
jgi:predicted transposase YbfD/YdcC